MRLLWVTAETPDRSAGGGSIRIHNLIQRLAGLAQVDLVMTGRLPDRQLSNSLNALVELPAPRPRQSGPGLLMKAREVVDVEVCRQTPAVAATRRQRQVLRKWVAAHAGQYDVVHLEHDYLMGVRGDAPRSGRPAWAITFHHLVSEQIKQRQAVEPAGSMKRAHLMRLRELAARMEHGATREFDLVCATSPEDVRVLGEATHLIPNGVDLDRFRPTPLPNAPTLVFTGRLDYQPNVHGTHWFCSEVFPRIREKLPDARLQLVGREPVPSVTRLGALPHVEVIPNVPDIRPYVEGARVAVVPLPVGSGTRLKALEAMASARPVAGTSVGLDGLSLEAGVHAEVADNAADLASACLRLLTDAEHARRIAAEGRRHVESHFGWDQIAMGFHQALMLLVGRHGPSAAA